MNLQYFGGRGSTSSTSSSTSSGGSSSAMAAERGLYSLPKNVSQRAVKELINDAPNGTIFAYKSERGNQQVLEKVSDGLSGPIFVQIEMTDNGMSISTPKDPVRSIQSALRSGDKLGLSGSYADRYKKNSRNMINQYGVGVPGSRR